MTHPQDTDLTRELAEIVGSADGGLCQICYVGRENLAYSVTQATQRTCPLWVRDMIRAIENFLEQIERAPEPTQCICCQREFHASNLPGGFILLTRCEFPGQSDDTAKENESVYTHALVSAVCQPCDATRKAVDICQTAIALFRRLMPAIVFEQLTVSSTAGHA